MILTSRLTTDDSRQCLTFSVKYSINRLITQETEARITKGLVCVLEGFNRIVEI